MSSASTETQNDPELQRTEASDGGTLLHGPVLAPVPAPAAALGAPGGPNNPQVPAYVPTHFNGELPAAKGDVAKELDSSTKQDQRERAQYLFDFLSNDGSDLRGLNDSQGAYTALVAVPDTHKVKVIYGMGYGTQGVGPASPIATKILAMYGEGGNNIGSPPVLISDGAVRTMTKILTPTDDVVQTAFQNGHVLGRPVIRANLLTATEDIMKMVPIPAYLVLDGLEDDIEAAVVYERLLLSSHDSTMKTHALAFLRAVLVGNFRQADEKPFITRENFYGMIPVQGRIWGSTRFQQLFSRIMAPTNIQPRVPTQPQLQLGGTPQQGNIVQLDIATLQQLLQGAVGASSPSTTPSEEKTEESGLKKISEREKNNMRILCGIPPSASDDALPQWYLDLCEKNLDDKDKAQVIAYQMESTWIFDDAEVPLYPALVKTIRKRDWVASDLGTRAAFVNALKGLSPFAMLDLTEEEVADMHELDADITAATAVTASDHRQARMKLRAHVPESAEDFMLMLKRYTNFIFALFGSQSPLYKCMYSVVQALREYSQQARKALTTHTKASILWTILLQSRRFAQGKMIGETACLGEFTSVLTNLRAKSAVILHAEVPVELIEPASTPKRKYEDLPEPDRVVKNRKQLSASAPWHPLLKRALESPLRDAGYPPLGKICQMCGLNQALLVPDFDDTVCRYHLVLGECKAPHTCKRKHVTASDTQAKTIIEKLSAFIKKPLELKGKK